MSKTVKKSDVCESARLARKYAKTGDVDILPAYREMCRSLARQAFGVGQEGRYSCFYGLINAICGVMPIKAAASNADVIAVLNVLGIEVIGEEGTEG